MRGGKYGNNANKRKTEANVNLAFDDLFIRSNKKKEARDFNNSYDGSES